MGGVCVVTQQSDPSRLSGPAHASQTLSRSGLSPQCGGAARESVPGGFHSFREALLRTSPLTGNHSCSCTRAAAGLQLQAGGASVLPWQLRCDGTQFRAVLLLTCTYYGVRAGLQSDSDPLKTGFHVLFVWCRQVPSNL